MRCVFPSAVKPWQKALCAAVGVGSHVGGLYGTGKVIGWTTRERERNVTLVTLVTLVKHVPSEPSEPWVEVDTSGLPFRIATEVVAPGAVGALLLHSTNQDPLFMWRAFLEEQSAATLCDRLLASASWVLW